ncbi:thioredoxin-like protein [Lasiosphaeria hispida]|uniref:Thioredoxin-like protein n=1 Tax=Lasiosphaeria hispida TaxID=260671 RepID=A0AAJ0HLV6_9PEZI|nr:thioredoxin-like protein [Lasiosphaeria hispida]
MSNPTPAQEEFADLLAKNAADDNREHPEDRRAAAREAAEHHNDDDEEDRYRADQIEAAMRMPTIDSRGEVKLPPASFDTNHATGVKGVIADARSYETARRMKWKDRVRAARRSVFGLDGGKHGGSSGPESDGSGAEDPDEESFLQQWRESRKRELEAETRGPAVRNRRTSPSVRLYGRLDAVDAMGYLDAIEKVGRETIVVVFVYDNECPVSAAIEGALFPLVATHPVVHFVKVHYDDIEFDNAAVPAILAYRNQGDLFANMTGLIELIPEDEDFDSNSLKRLLKKYNIL